MSYVPSTPAERQEMLRAVGVQDYRELYRDVPAEMLLDRQLDLPAGMSELEVSRAVSAMAAGRKREQARINTIQAVSSVLNVFFIGVTPSFLGLRVYHNLYFLKKQAINWLNSK